MTKRNGGAAFAAPAGLRAVRGGDSRLYSTTRSASEELDRVRSALAFIDPHDHDTWLRVMMGVHAEFGEDGWHIFDEWSRGAESYDAKVNRARWKSMKPGGGVTIATIFDMARKNDWRDDGRHILPDPEELARRHRERATADAEAIARKEARAVEAAKKAAAIWSIAIPARVDNTYCWRKGIKPTETLREIEADKAETVLGYVPSAKLEGRLLVVPIKVGDKLSSVQLVDGAGRKHFLAGGAVGGGYWASERMPAGDGTGKMVLIGEGVATVLSAQPAKPTALGVAAMSNGNIPKVARQLRERYPRADLVILADLDKTTGTSDRHAVEAAAAVGGRLAVPQFDDGPAPERKDFNDAARVHGPAAVLTAIEAAIIVEATALTPQKHSPSKSRAPASSRSDSAGEVTVELVAAADIPPERVDWLWDGYLARGKMHVLGGKPTAGKTTLALDMAATVSTGGTWPDSSSCTQGLVVIWTGEDGLADTLVPRLMAAAADLSRVHFVKGATVSNEAIPFDPACHMPALEDALSTLGNVSLLIVDPIVSAVAGDSHKNGEVRRALQPLADLAANLKCSVLGITHFTKGTSGRDPVERLTGSLAFGALARVVMVAAKSEDGEGDGRASESKRIFVRAKSNIGPDGGGFEYELIQREIHNQAGFTASVVRWGQAIDGNAREILAAAEATDGDDAGKLGQAVDWLRDFLRPGPKAAATVFAEAKAAGHSKATIQRAKSKLGITPTKAGMSEGWTWALVRTCSSVSEQENMSTFGDFEHLRTQNDDHNGDVEGEL